MSVIELFPVGIKTAQGKYLTVEAFGDQLNANGASLRSKQVFFLETDGQGKHAFRTHKKKYLSADHKEASASAASKNKNEWFTLGFNNGLVSIKTSEGKYLSVDGANNISVNASSVGPNEEFEIEINMHPQICLITQKRYIGLDKSGSVVSNLNSQFGRETMWTKVPGGSRGQYALQAFNGKYLSCDPSGRAVATHASPDDSCMFAFEPVLDNFAIKHIKSGNYLSALGNGLKAARPTVGPVKEIFSVKDSDAQVALKAENGKYLSYQGTNLISNKTSITNDEVFVMEFQGDKFSLKNVEEKFWSAKPDGSLTLDTSSRGENELFQIEYHDNKVAFKTAHGTYLRAQKLGGVDAKAKSVEGSSLFEMFLYNRPKLVLQAPQSSFVGQGKNGIMSNKIQPETFNVEFKDGRSALQTADGKYVTVGEGNKLVPGSQPTWFVMELKKHSKLALRAPNGKFIKSENQGWLVASSDNPGANEFFEF